MGLLAILGLERGAQGVALPGGGTVDLPARYKPVLPGDYRHQDTGTVVAYRRHHATMAGSSECDGMLAVGNAHGFESLKDFVQSARAMLTTHWAYANESEGHWYGRAESYPETEAPGPNGEERVGRLVVHTVGWRVYDIPARLYAINHMRGVMIAIWISDRHGGETRARKMADRIAGSLNV